MSCASAPFTSVITVEFCLQFHYYPLMKPELQSLKTFSIGLGLLAWAPCVFLFFPLLLSHIWFLLPASPCPQWSFTDILCHNPDTALPQSLLSFSLLLPRGTGCLFWTKPILVCISPLISGIPELLVTTGGSGRWGHCLCLACRCHTTPPHPFHGIRRGCGIAIKQWKLSPLGWYGLPERQADRQLSRSERQANASQTNLVYGTWLKLVIMLTVCPTPAIPPTLSVETRMTLCSDLLII